MTIRYVQINQILSLYSDSCFTCYEIRLIMPYFLISTLHVYNKFDKFYVITNLVRTTRFGIPFIRYTQNRKIGKPNNLKVFGGNKAKDLNMIVKITGLIGQYTIMGQKSFSTKLFPYKFHLKTFTGHVENTCMTAPFH